MKRGDLDGALLASVSRSFYLTIRVLPRTLRAPIALAYLLARASDTIADTGNISAAVRKKHLSAFGCMLQNGSRAGLAELQRDIQPSHPGERELIARLDRCLDWLHTIPAPDKAEIIRVLDKIISGQTLDLERFGDSDGAGRIVALPTGAELDEYIYLVAGCVGEFWTRLCLRHLRNYSHLGDGPLCALALRYGKGLQLINILRDLPADLRDGRCYLPEDELRAAGSAPETVLVRTEASRTVFNAWAARAAEYLDDGREYIRSLQPARLRLGCFLPWYLGKETLEQMRANPPLETPRKVKVPRSTVRKALFLGCVAAISNAPLARNR